LSAAWRQPAGKTPLPTPHQHNPQHAHLRCETQPGAPAQPLSCLSAACRQPAGKTPLPTPHQHNPQRPHLRCETQPGASAQPLNRLSAAWRQPAGKRPCQRPTNTTASARTFGAKHSRGLPPNRSAEWRQPYGPEVLWNPVNRWVKTREGEAPAERPNADPRCKRLPAILRSIGDRRSPRRRDAAQQGLRPPGTPSCQKVKTIRLPPCGREYQRSGGSLRLRFAPQAREPYPPIAWCPVRILRRSVGELCFLE